ncbi:hypothetical protein Q1695_003682 [Nippostrongylus brasiliensis]|nr:hypothetical protein Q1695_003682 [Nippostrongylus brasiliensis]
MQLLLSPESQEKCGWATHRGVYQFVCLPFGNAGAYFCRAMSRILAGLDDNCLACLDDIIILDKDFRLTSPHSAQGPRAVSSFQYYGGR